MTEETQVETPIEDAPIEPVETQDADSSPAVETEVDTPDDAGTERPRDEDGKFISAKAQKRIDHLTWEKNQREREAEYWRQQALQTQKAEPVKAPEPVAIPSLESVGYDEAKYQSALIEHVNRQAESVVERRLAEADKQRAEQSRMEGFAARQREFAKATPDFEDKVLRDPTLPITVAMRDVILDSPAGPEVAYYLANNRDAAQQIAALPAHLAALEMGRIEGRLAAQKEAKTRPVVTKAPPPTPTIDAVEPEVTKDPEQMTADEWLKWREKDLRRKSAGKR